MIHASVLLVILLVAPPLAASIPMAVLAAILLVVAYNVGEWARFRNCGDRDGPIASSGWSRSR